MGKYEKPKLILDETEEEMWVDVHSSGIGLAIVGGMIIYMAWPPIKVQ